MIADFGPVSTIRQQDSEFKKGDRVRAQGQENKVDRKPVFFVLSHDLDDESRNRDSSRTDRAREMAKNKTGMSNPEINAIEG